MIQEIKNMDEYNPRYTKNGALKWQHINDGRNKKRYSKRIYCRFVL